MKKLKRKWKCFVQYLVKIYLSENAKFPHRIWNYHYTILNEHDRMSRQNALKKVKEFHVDQIALYTQNVVGNKMNKIKPKYLNRENLSQEDQILNLEY